MMQVKCGSINLCMDQQERRSSAREWKIISRKDNKLLIPNTHNSTAANNSTCKHITNTRKMVPITGRASSILEKNVFFKSNLNQIHSFFALFSSSVTRVNLSCVVATIFSSLVFLSSSVPMANQSRLVAASFSSFAPLSSSVNTANLSCLLATTFSCLRSLSNSFSSPRFNLLRVARCCFSWSSVSDVLFFSSCSFFLFSYLLYLFCVLSSAFLSSVLQSLKLCLL